MHTTAHVSGDTPSPGQARTLWPAFETIHATVYFAPEAPEAYRALGLKGGWMGYFATRSAAMGAASPGLVTAVFYNFHPAMVARALPDAWALATPEEVLAARLGVVDAALRRLLPEHVATPALAEAAALAREAAEAPALSGRPLYGALRSLAWPDPPHLILWHASTLLREHRGDGHVAALTAAGLDGCEAHVVLAATGRVTRATLQDNRKWSDAEWADAESPPRSPGLAGRRREPHRGRSGRPAAGGGHHRCPGRRPLGPPRPGAHHPAARPPHPPGPDHRRAGRGPRSQSGRGPGPLTHFWGRICPTGGDFRHQKAERPR